MVVIKVMPVDVRVQRMVCELLEDTKARFEETVKWLTEEVEEDRVRMEEEKKSEYGNPAMYQRFIDTHLELIAEHKEGIIGMDGFIRQAKGLYQDLADFWEQRDKAREKRMKKAQGEDNDQR